MIFPCINAISCIILISLIVAPLWYFLGQHWIPGQALHTEEIAIFMLILALLFISNLIILFCNTALVATTMAYCKQQPIKLSLGFKAATICFPQIVTWTLFNTTIGPILRFFQTRVSQISFLTNSLAGITWSVICYLVTPIIVIEKSWPLTTVKRSSSLLQQTWGTFLVSNLGLGTIAFCARLIAIIPLIIGFCLGNFIDKIIGSSISVILLFLIAIFNIAIHNVLRCVIYRYAVDKEIVPPFSLTSLEHIFRQRQT
jgi:hypothetical protein